MPALKGHPTLCRFLTKTIPFQVYQFSGASFSELPICESPDQNTCWMTWNTYLADYYPPYHKTWYSNAAAYSYRSSYSREDCVGAGVGGSGM